MPDTVIAAALTLDANSAGQSVKSFRSELKQANENLLQIQKNFGDLSPQAIEAAKKVSQLKDQIQDAKEVSALFDPGAKFSAFSNVVRTTTGGVAALTGSLALFGTQSEDVEKTLVKLQAALALSEGVNTIADSAKDFERLSAVIKSTTVYQKALAISTSLTSKAFAAFGISVETTSVAFKVLRTAIITTGIGALVVAIGFVIDKISTWQSETEKQIEKQNQLNKALAETVEGTYGKRLKAFDQEQKLEEARAKLRGASEQELYNIQKKYDTKRENEKRVHLLEIGRLDGESIAKNKEDLQNFQTEVTVKELQFQLAQKQARKQAGDKQLEQQKALNEKLREEEKQAYLKRKEDAKNLEIVSLEQMQQDAEDKRKREQDAQDEVLNSQTKSLDGKQGAFAGFGNEATAQLEQQRALQEELSKLQRDGQDNRFADLEKWYADKLKLVGDNEFLQAQLTEQYENIKTALVEEQNRARFQTTANLLGQASQLFGEQTAAFKVLAIAEATISTYLAATKAVQASAGTGPFGVTVGLIQAGIAIAAGLKNIKEITKVKVPGGGGGGSVMPTISAQAPLKPVAPVQQSSLVDSEGTNNAGNAAVKTYVLTGEINNEQEQLSRIARAARLGG